MASTAGAVVTAINAITVDPAGPCQRLQDQVHCVQGRSRLDTLLAVDRPILLRLHASNTVPEHPAGADARGWRAVELGGQRFDVDRQVLQAQWDGSYAGLWRGPAVLDTPPDYG